MADSPSVTDDEIFDAQEEQARPRNADGTFAKTATSPTEPVVSPAPKPKHPPYLISQAKDFGFDDSEIESMSPDQLGSIVWRMVRQRDADQRALRDEMRSLRTVQDSQVKQLPPEPEEQLDIDWGTDEDGRPISEKDVAPHIVAALKSVHRKSNKELKELKGKLGEYEQREQVRAQSEKDRQIDAAFERLGPDFHAHFGEGSIQDLAADSDERARRFAVVSVALSTKDGSFESRLRNAAKRLFGSKDAGAKDGPASKEPASEYLAGAKNGVKPPRITPEQWNEGALTAPTSRKGAELPYGDERAVRNMERKLRDSSETSSVGDDLDD